MEQMENIGDWTLVYITIGVYSPIDANNRGPPQ